MDQGRRNDPGLGANPRSRCPLNPARAQDQERPREGLRPLRVQRLLQQNLQRGPRIHRSIRYHDDTFCDVTKYTKNKLKLH